MAQAEVAAAAETREPQKIRRDHMEIHDASGHRWRTWKVLWPEGNVLQDVTDHPNLWSSNQVSRETALRMDDRLYIVAFDRSWACEAVVVDADDRRVVLSKPRVVWSGETPRLGIRWEDDHHEVEWAGRGWAIYKKPVGNRPRSLFKDGFATVDAAKAAALKSYPRQVG